MTSKLLVFIASLLIALEVSAQVYHYKDSRGRKVYVDSLSKVPAQYRDQLKQHQAKQLNVGREQSLESSDGSLVEDATEQRFLLRRALGKLDEQLERMKTPVQISNNQVIVPVVVELKRRTQSLRLLLDTGASLTVLHEDALANLSLGKTKKSHAQVAGGGIIDIQHLVFDNISFGHFKVRGKRMAVIENHTPSGFDGLLGMDLLARADYKIDFAERMIIWDQQNYQRLLEKRQQLQEKLANANP